MLRHGRSRHREGTGQFADWAWPLREPLNHLSPGRITECHKGIQYQRVSHS